MYHVLLVDDDVHILRTNAAFLKQKDYTVFCANSGAQALRIAAEQDLDAVILDVDMPQMNGKEVCRQLREKSSMPILFLSAYASTDERIQGLLAGGDDFIAKPYSLIELELRLRLHIQREQSVPHQKVLDFGGLRIDLSLQEVYYQQHAISFTALEFDLLAFLAQHPNQVFSYEQLHDAVWHAPMHQGLHNIQVCMARVRQKLDQLCPNLHYIETVRRKGYRFLSQPKPEE